MSEIKVTQQQIDKLLNQSNKFVETIFGKTTVVTVKLPNGYTLTASSGCVDQANYDQELGAKLCMEQIEHQLWQLEGYKLQSEMQAVPCPKLDDKTGEMYFGKDKNSYLKFQTGVVKENGVNGVQVDEVIDCLIQRMEYLNSRKSDNYNDSTIFHLKQAYNAQRDRTIDRKSRGIEGTEND